MSFGYGFSLPNWQTLSGGFTPASLFAAGEVGAWYDPSDLTTLFQDSSGTTPVTAVEQSVGLMLDKSKGLVLGPELVTNGDFSNGTTGWTAVGLTIAVVGGELQMTRTGSSQYVYQTLTTVAGRRYSVTFNYRNGTTSSAVAVGSTVGGVDLFPVTTVNSVSTATYTLSFLATGVASTIFWGLNAVSSTAFIDNVSVKEVPGNHAYQSTSTSRPVLRARYNLLTYSEQFDNAVWTKNALNTTGTPPWIDVAVAPDGTTTADKLVENNSNAIHTIGSAVQTITAGVTYAFSFFAKAGERSVAQIAPSSTSFGALAYANYDLSAGSVSASAVGIPSMQNVGNGWYQCIFVIAATSTAATGPINISIQTSPSAARGASYTGDGTSGLYIWGAQLIVTNSLTSNAYQRIAAATDYATAGFLPYLSFDGTDDSLLTNSVDFSATDKMTVWAGVRKLSDAAAGVVAELSADASANNGAFVTLVSTSLSDASRRTFGGNLRGTLDLPYGSATFAAPITAVLSQNLDIVASTPETEVQQRINSVAQTITISGTTAGTGNFGNYPIYLGRRGGASLPFNGNLYSLIIRGAQSTASQISATETWVNGKTGAY